MSQETLLVRAGDPCRSVFLLVSGWAYRQRVLPNGRRPILDIYVAGDFIGLDHLFRRRATENVATLTTAGCLELDCDALLALFRQNPDVAAEIARQLVEEKRRLERHTVLIARSPATERTVAELHRLWKRSPASRAGQEARGGHAALRLPLTQQSLADYLGLSVIYVSRTLRRLQTDHMLEVESDAIVIDDIHRLAAAAPSLVDPAC